MFQKYPYSSYMPGTSMMPIGVPPSGEITQLQSPAVQQQNAGDHELMEQNSDINSKHSRSTQPPSFSDTLKEDVSRAPRTQKIIWMKIVPLFRKEHFQYPQLLQEDIGKAMLRCWVPFVQNFETRLRYREQIYCNMDGIYRFWWWLPQGRPKKMWRKQSWWA